MTVSLKFDNNAIIADFATIHSQCHPARSVAQSQDLMHSPADVAWLLR